MLPNSTTKIKTTRKAVLVDANDKVLGYKNVIETHKNPVPLHRAISVVIYDKSGKFMLLQKRSKYKIHWPHFWSNTVCTNVKPGETYKHAAIRRLNEEMGIKTLLKEIFKFIYKSEYDKTWGEHELDHVFAGKYEGKITPDPLEAGGYDWISVADLKKDIKTNPGKYTPWFKIILKKISGPGSK